jgi:phage I-like protein
MSQLRKYYSSNNVIPEVKEGALPTRIQLFKAGNNPNSYQETAVYNPELKETILSNQLNQDGRDLYPIDLEHERGASQGWFSLTLDEEGIWADNIQWTKKGTQALLDREFRYYSPTFFTDEEGNIIQIDSFALTNSPALYGLTPIVASKESKEMSTVSDKVEEFKAAVEASDPMGTEEPMDEKDQVISDLQSQNEMLQSKLSEALAKLDAIEQEKMAKEKEDTLASIDFTSEEEKQFFSKLSLDALKEYSQIKGQSKSVALHKEEVIEEIKIEEPEFTKKEKPSTNVLSLSKKSTLPSIEQIQARAQQIADQRKLIK